MSDSSEARREQALQSEIRYMQASGWGGIDPEVIERFANNKPAGFRPDWNFVPGQPISPDQLQSIVDLIRDEYQGGAGMTIDRYLADPRAVVRMENGQYVYRPELSSVAQDGKDWLGIDRANGFWDGPGPFALSLAALGMPFAASLGAAGAAAGGGAGAASPLPAELSNFTLAGPGTGIGGVGSANIGLNAAGLGLSPELIAAGGGSSAFGIGGGLGLQAVNSLGLPLSAAELGAGALGATGMPVPTEAPGLTQAPAPVQNITTPGPLPGTTTVPAGTMTTGAAGTGTSALSQLLKSTLGIDVAPGTLDLIGKGLGLGLGVYGSNKQADATKSLADQYMSMGAPYRTSLAQLEANPEGFYKSPLVQGALQQGSDALARSLSAKVGNPILNPTALQEMQNFTTRGLLDAYNNRFSQLAGAGQLGVSQAAPLGVQANQAQGTTYNALGAGIQSVFGNQRDYTGELLDMLRGRQSFGSTSLA